MIIISELGKLSWVLARRSAMWFVGDVTADVTSLGVQIPGLGDCKLSWLHHPMEKGSQSNVTVRIVCPLSSLPGLDLVVLGIGR